MKRIASLLPILLLMAVAVDAPPAVFVVRHAEKAKGGGNDPELSSAGRERANALARILKDSQMTAIFVTEFKRTQETAVPTAKETHIPPTIVPVHRYSRAGCKITRSERKCARRGSWQHHSRLAESTRHCDTHQHS